MPARRGQALAQSPLRGRRGGPGAQEKALDVAELLLSFSADPTFRNPLGQTPAQVAQRRGLDDAADALEEAAKQVSGDA